MLFKYCLVSFLLLSLFIATSFADKQKCTRYKPKAPTYNNFKNKTISDLKCKEYMDNLYEREQKRKYECRKNSFQVSRGKKAKPSDYPHMGALGWKTTNGEWIFLCGSSLISDRFVLTSAHCTKTIRVNSMKPEPQIVRFGAVDIYNPSSKSRIDVKIKTIIRHYNYKSPKKYFDIALIELKTKVNFNKYIHPACLYSQHTVDVRNKTLTVTGWGETENTTHSPILLYTTVDILNSHFHLIKTNRNWWGPSDHQICAGKLNGTADTCDGDSGGPLQFKLYKTKKEGTMHTIVGITSFGSSVCGKRDSLGVYTKVSKFRKWIENHVWKDEQRIVYPDS